MAKLKIASEDQILNLVEKGYRAAVDAAMWHDFLTELGTICHARTSLALQDDAANSPITLTTACFENKWVSIYADHFATQNLWLANLHRAPIGIPCEDKLLVPRAELSRSAFYNDWLKPQGTFGGTTVSLYRSEGRLFNLGLHQQDQSSIDETLPLLALLAPHMTRAAQLHRRLAEATRQQRLVEAVLDRLPDGILLVDQRAILRFANQSAQRILRRGDGLRLDAAGRLRAVHLDDSQLLEALVAGAIRRDGSSRAAGGTTALRRRGTNHPYAVMVAPIAADDPNFLWSRGTAVVIFVHDPEAARRLPSDAIASLLGLTMAEGRIAAAVAAGRTPQQAAEEFDVSVNTVRSQIRAILGKLGLGRQADLVRLVLDIERLLT